MDLFTAKTFSDSLALIALQFHTEDKLSRGALHRSTSPAPDLLGFCDCQGDDGGAAYVQSLQHYSACRATRSPG
jgi:hypothetical protein